MANARVRVCGNCHAEVADGASACARCGVDLPRGVLAALGSLFRRGRSPDPPRAEAPLAPFAFEVEDAFVITGRGTFATGRVTRGRIAIGDEIAFRPVNRDTVQRRVMAIEMFQKTAAAASEGETAGLLLSKAVPLDVLNRGVVFERA